MGEERLYDNRISVTTVLDGLLSPSRPTSKLLLAGLTPRERGSREPVGHLGMDTETVV